MAALEAGLCCMERHEKRPEVPCEKQCASGTGPKVVLDKELSQGEKVATNARRKEVSKCFQRLGITGRQDHEPVIAVLGSGGGLRAMIGLLGTLRVLADQDFLDAITYLCGTSGSTWCMASLYDSDMWSKSMKEMEQKVCNRLTKTACNWVKAWEKLQETSKEKVQSLTNIWAYIIIHKMTREINEQKMSSHQAACENGRNPYPVYSAVEKSNVTKKRPNEPGLWGSALACKEEIWNTVIDFLRDVFTGSCCSDTAEQGAGLYSCPECSCRGCKGVGILLSDENLLKMKDPHKAQRLRHLAHVLKEIMERDLEEMSSETISEEVEYTLEVLQDTLNNTTGTCEMFKVIYHALACLANWEWGTTHNFLYNWKRSGGIPKDLTNQRYICLIDAGLEINSAYPLMLPPHRQVDLILSFDFSAGDPFMTLKQTAEYCRHNRIPFPKIHIEQGEEDNPSKSCYIFDGGESRTVPVVLHFPLFNRQNCQDDVQEWRERFTTFKLNYEESEVQDLLAVSKRNVELSKEKILEKLKQVYKE
ncbi:hypothetical protein FKM82_005208 [Ascaphus truei]